MSRAARAPGALSGALAAHLPKGDADENRSNVERVRAARKRTMKLATIAGIDASVAARRVRGLA